MGQASEIFGTYHHSAVSREWWMLNIVQRVWTVKSGETRVFQAGTDQKVNKLNFLLAFGSCLWLSRYIIFP
jgi:hypothetical protein